MELYGFQQSLAKLQMSLEKAQGNYQSLSAVRVQVGVASTRHADLVRSCLTGNKRQQMHKCSRLNSTCNTAQHCSCVAHATTDRTALTLSCSTLQA